MDLIKQIEHLTGFCGEAHLNLYHILFFVILYKIILYIYKTLA